jgi:hypothetical protein
MPRASRFSLHAFLVGAALLLGACAHNMNYMEMKALMPPAPADKGRIYFYRTTAWLGNVVTPDILLNDVSVGLSSPGTFFYVDREPGAYRALCGNSGDYRAVNFNLAAGQEVYVRTAVASGIVTANMQTELVEATVAIPELRELKYDAVK